jgi:Zn-finger nucleic acid-binding protein
VFHTCGYFTVPTAQSEVIGFPIDTCSRVKGILSDKNQSLNNELAMKKQSKMKLQQQKTKNKNKKQPTQDPFQKITEVKRT